MSDHPTLDDRAIWALNIIAAGLKEDPGYLIGAGYPTEVLTLLGGGAGPGRVMAIDTIETSLEGLDVMAEVEALFTDLKAERQLFSTKDASEKMAYFRISTALLEKLVALKERASNVRQIGKFYSEVLAVMEEVMTPGQVGAVRSRLVAQMGMGMGGAV